MFKKIIKKLILATTLVCVAGTVAAASACTIETKHPEIRITVEFNGEDYKLDYTLYRNMYPNTVRHFLELADANYYDGTIIHDYRTNDWFGGGYAYDKSAYAALADNTTAGGSYLEEHSLEEQYLELFKGGKLTSTVFSNIKYEGEQQVLVKESALPTLIGEFTTNKHEIEKGALSANIGVLKMFYYSKTTDGMVYVTPTEDQLYWADYKYNCATSLFAMQVGGSSSYGANNYCVFGKMESTSALTDLKDAVADYLAELSRTYYEANGVAIDNLVEQFSQADSSAEVNFQLPAEPIIIKTVKITKW